MTVENAPETILDTVATETRQSCEKPGQLLKEKREALGITSQQAAQDLNFLPIYIPSLENEDFKPLHNPTFIKGYLRAYARYLKLDVDKVLYCFAHHYPELAVQETKPPVEIMKPESSTSGFMFKLLSFVLVVVLLALIIVWWQSGKEDLPLGNNLAQVKIETLEGTIDASKIVANSEEENLAATTQEEIVEETSVTPRANATDLPKIAPEVKQVAAQPEVAEPEKVASTTVNRKPEIFLGNLYLATSNKANQLGFIFTGDCWVEVRDANQKLLIANLMQADEQLLVEGEAPFKIVFGNGTAAKLVYLGEDLNFSHRVRSNGYASVEVGAN